MEYSSQLVGMTFNVFLYLSKFACYLTSCYQQFPKGSPVGPKALATFAKNQQIRKRFEVPAGTCLPRMENDPGEFVSRFTFRGFHL